ncbi:hypothetical protein QFZ91_007420 [Paraburkholderia sp. JPY419]
MSTREAIPCVVFPIVTLRTFCEMSCEFGTITVDLSASWI